MVTGVEVGMHARDVFTHVNGVGARRRWLDGHLQNLKCESVEFRRVCVHVPKYRAKRQRNAAREILVSCFCILERSRLKAAAA